MPTLALLLLSLSCAPSRAASVSGELEAIEAVPIRPKISGRVISVKAALQARVTEQQVLAVEAKTKDTAYSLKKLYERLGALPADEVLVVLDSCFSGVGRHSLLAKGARPLVLRTAPPALPANRAVLTAAKGSQISTSSEEKRHGVFTWHFLRALQQGKGSLSEVYEAAAPAVEDEARSLNVEQVPEMLPPAEEAKGRFLLKAR